MNKVETENSKPAGPISNLAVSIIVGTALGPVIAYFISHVVFVPDGVTSIGDIVVPQVSASSMLTFYGVLATIIVALAFGKNLTRDNFEIDAEDLEKENQRNKLNQLALVIISLLAVSSAVIYAISRFSNSTYKSLAADVLIVFAVYVTATLLPLIGSLATVTKSQQLLHAKAELPKLRDRVENTRAKMLKSVGHLPERLTKKELFTLVVAHIAWPLSMLGPLTIFLRWLWADLTITTWSLDPWFLAVGFLLLTYALVIIANIGWAWPFEVVRILGILFFFVTVIDFFVLIRALDPEYEHTSRTIWSFVLSAIVMAGVMYPWVVRKKSVPYQKRRIFPNHVYFLRAHILGEGFRTRERYLVSQESLLESEDKSEEEEAQARAGPYSNSGSSALVAAFVGAASFALGAARAKRRQK